MKKLILSFAVVTLSTIAVFAQTTTDKKSTPAPTPASSQTPAAAQTKASDQAVTPTRAADQKHSATMHYTWMNGKLMNCKGETAEPQTADVKLKDGSTVTTKGEIIGKDGKKTMMKNGECVDMNGKVMDHKMAHAKEMKKDDSMKK